MDIKSVTSNTFRFLANRTPIQVEASVFCGSGSIERMVDAQSEASVDTHMTIKESVSKKPLNLEKMMFLENKTADKEDQPTLESLPEPESPIRASIPRKILADAQNRMPHSAKPILEFRRKKVIKAEDKKFLQLLKAHNYTQDFTEEASSAVRVEPVKPTEESHIIKKIRKSAILRKVHNFWDQKSLYYPTVFKKLQKAEDELNFYYELQDLSKEQFHETDKSCPSQLISQ